MLATAVNVVYTVPAENPVQRWHDDVAGAAPGLRQALPCDNIADLLRGQGERRSSEDGGGGQCDPGSCPLGDTAQNHGYLEIQNF